MLVFKLHVGPIMNKTLNLHQPNERDAIPLSKALCFASHLPIDLDKSTMSN